jgi:hypothetical protein
MRRRACQAISNGIFIYLFTIVDFHDRQTAKGGVNVEKDPLFETTELLPTPRQVGIFTTREPNPILPCFVAETLTTVHDIHDETILCNRITSIGALVDDDDGVCVSRHGPPATISPQNATLFGCIIIIVVIFRRGRDGDDDRPRRWNCQHQTISRR